MRSPCYCIRCLTVEFHLSAVGVLIPGGDHDTKSTFRVGEWVYLKELPLSPLFLTYQGHKFSLTYVVEEMSPEVLVEGVFWQWLRVLEQKRDNKETLPSSDLSEFMGRIFSHNHEGGLPQRLINIQQKVKDILREHTYDQEYEDLAPEKLVRIKVKGKKSRTKALRLRGHTNDDYIKDIQPFLDVLEPHKLSRLSAEDCCNITRSSTLLELQEGKQMRTLIEKKNKYVVLYNFTMSGIPVYAPRSNCRVLNVWALRIKRISSSYYSTMSQVVLNEYPGKTGEHHKGIQFDTGNFNSNFNAVVPLFSSKNAKLMAPVMLTKVYQMCATYAILRHPQISDVNIHMAALGVCWARIINDHPDKPRRPDHVQKRMNDIEATAEVYLSRDDYSYYCKALKENTNKALMAETFPSSTTNTTTTTTTTLKSETLVKPMFVLMLMHRRGEVEEKDVERIVRLIAMEYVGRCLTERSTFQGLFLDTRHLIYTWLQKCHTEANGISYHPSELLKSFYTLDDLKTKLEEVRQKIESQRTAYINTDSVVTRMPVGVEDLNYIESAGDISWNVLRQFAKEVGLSPHAVHDIFNDERSIFAYTYHVLAHRRGGFVSAAAAAAPGISSSQARLLNNDVKPYKIAEDLVKWQICQELLLTEDLREKIRKFIQEPLLSCWITAYDSVHAHVGGQHLHHVDDITSCQVSSCPFYRIENRDYKKHADRMHSFQPT